MTYEVRLLDPTERADVARCFQVFTHLRPHVSEAQFLERVPLQAREGYRIAYIERDGRVAAGAGFRFLNTLAWGKVLYVDDLITDPGLKRQGLGGALMDWLIARARADQCDQLHLDSGHQRLDAHRLYLNKGLHLSSHHLSIVLRK